MTHVERKRINNGGDLPKHWIGAAIQGAMLVAGQIGQGFANLKGASQYGQQLEANRSASARQLDVGGYGYTSYDTSDLDAAEQLVKDEAANMAMSGNFIGAIFSKSAQKKKLAAIRKERWERGLSLDFGKSLATDLRYQDLIEANNMKQGIISAKNGIVPKHSFGWGDGMKLGFGLLSGNWGGIGAAIGDAATTLYNDYKANKSAKQTQQLRVGDRNEFVQQQEQLQNNYLDVLNQELSVPNKPGFRNSIPSHSLGATSFTSHSKFIKTNKPVFTPYGVMNAGKQNAWVNKGETMYKKDGDSPVDYHAALVRYSKGKGIDKGAGIVDDNTGIGGAMRDPVTGMRIQDLMKPSTQEIEYWDNYLPKINDKLNKLRGFMGRTTDARQKQQLALAKESSVAENKYYANLNEQLVNGQTNDSDLVHAKCGLPSHWPGLATDDEDRLSDDSFPTTTMAEISIKPQQSRAAAKRQASAFVPQLNKIKSNYLPYALGAYGQLGAVLPQLINAYKDVPAVQNTYAANPHTGMIKKTLDLMSYEVAKQNELRNANRSMLSGITDINKQGGLNAWQRASMRNILRQQYDAINGGIEGKYSALDNDRLKTIASIYTTLGEGDAQRRQNAAQVDTAANNANVAARYNAINAGWSNIGNIIGSFAKDLGQYNQFRLTMNQWNGQFKKRKR